MKWLWLEDNENSVLDIEEVLDKNGINYEKFSNPNELSKFINIHKENFDNYGFLIDVMLENQNNIVLTEELSGSDKFFDTGDGYNAGLVYANEVICGKDNDGITILDNIPPIIFLTVRDKQEVKDLFQKIQNKYVDTNEISLDKIKLDWYRKWDVAFEPENFINTIKSFESN